MLKICEQCYSVLCCRVSPKQKQEIVTLMRSQVFLINKENHYDTFDYLLIKISCLIIQL